MMFIILASECIQMFIYSSNRFILSYHVYYFLFIRMYFVTSVSLIFMNSATEVFNVLCVHTYNSFHYIIIIIKFDVQTLMNVPEDSTTVPLTVSTLKAATIALVKLGLSWRTMEPPVKVCTDGTHH